MAVISKNKELGEKPPSSSPFLSTALFLSFLPGLPRVILPSWPYPYLSSLQPALRDTQTQSTHLYPAGGQSLVSSFYPAAVFALGTAKFTSPVQVHAQPQGCILPCPEARGVWDPLGISGEVQPVEYKPWILLSKRTNSFLNTSLLFLLWFSMHLPKLLLCKCVRAWISARGSKVM